MERDRESLDRDRESRDRAELLRAAVDGRRSFSETGAGFFRDSDPLVLLGSGDRDSRRKPSKREKSFFAFVAFSVFVSGSSSSVGVNQK